MSRFAARDVSRFDLGDGDWVDLRTRLTFGERNQIQAKLLGPLPIDGAGRVDASKRDTDLGAANLELMRLVIVSWGGPGFCAQAAHPHDGDCQPQPITAQNIAGLDETAERILTEISQRMVTKTEGFTTPPSGAAEIASTSDASTSS